MKLPAVPKAFGTGYLLGKVKIIILSSFIPAPNVFGAGYSDDVPINHAPENG